MQIRRLIVGLIAFVAVAASQPPASSTANKKPGSVSGTVTNSITGEPVKGAEVSLRRGPFTYSAVTDIAGTFLVEGVAPGDGYQAWATHPGFSSSGPVTLAPRFSIGERENLKIGFLSLEPYGSVAGKVVDEDGEPIQNATVSLWRYVYLSGLKQIHQAQAESTNDRGEYRLFDVPPGRVYLRVGVGKALPVAARPMFDDAPEQRVHTSGPESGYATVFYPAATNLMEATPSEIRPGAETSGIDFTMRRKPAYHIRGKIVSSDGERTMSSLWAEPCPDGGSFGRSNSDLGVRPLPGGRFEVASAIPGTYCLTSHMDTPSGPVYGQRVVSLVDHDVDDVTVHLTPAFDLSGSVQIDGPAPAVVPNVKVVLRAVNGLGQVDASADAKGNFAFGLVSPMAYRWRVETTGQLYVKSVRYGGREVPEGTLVPEPGAGLTVILGADVGALEGSAQPSHSDKPVTTFAVVYSAKPWRVDLVRVVQVSESGAFSMDGLAPGDYHALAVETADADDLYNPDLRELLAHKAAAVTVSPHGRQPVQLKAVSPEELARARNRL